MQMKKLVVAGCAALALCAANAETDPAAGAVLSVDQVTQRYPWNGLVDIDYTISFAPGVSPSINDNLEVMMVDRAVSPAVTNRALTFLQAPLPMAEGSHRITWDANADGVTNRTDQAEIHIAFVHYAEAYMVIDVSGGSETNCYPVDFLNGAPPNGFNDPEYKGNKIVLRRINPGSYVAGSPDNEANRVTAVAEKQHRVVITRPFYIGIFEITQAQYANVMGSTGLNFSFPGDCRPAEGIPYNAIRGTPDTSSHRYDWPWNDDVDSDSIMGKLRTKCKSKDGNGNYTVVVSGFDLPTDFQWEYACRAGTTGAINTTDAYANTTAGQAGALAKMGRYRGNTTDGRGGYAEHTTVGSYEPNQWGLYDMLGNVWEWTRDWYTTDVTMLNPKQYIDPKGAASGTHRVGRGSGWKNDVNYTRSGARLNLDPTAADGNLGFRLSRFLP